MYYNLLKDIVGLVKEFEGENTNEKYPVTIDGFKKWIVEEINPGFSLETFEYEGKVTGRSLDSVISTLLIHLSRYARLYSKSIIINSPFSTQEEYIFLITLKTFGPMSKMELIKKNIQDKPGGMQIISRLIQSNFVQQENDLKDKRSKILSITPLGLDTLEEYMVNIRKATTIVAGKLNETEKMQLIHLLNKLEEFHWPIYSKNIEPEKLLDTVHNEFMN